MATVARTVNASPEKVFEILSDGWLYGLWVVGASQIRDVDAAWPAVGSCIHHSIGVWPLVLSDETEVVEVDQPRRLVLSTKARPLGVAKVSIVVQLAGDRTAITMDEVPTAGPGTVGAQPAQRRGSAHPQRRVVEPARFRGGEPRPRVDVPGRQADADRGTRAVRCRARPVLTGSATWAGRQRDFRVRT